MQTAHETISSRSSEYVEIQNQGTLQGQALPNYKSFAQPANEQASQAHAPTQEPAATAHTRETSNDYSLRSSNEGKRFPSCIGIYINCNAEDEKALQLRLIFGMMIFNLEQSLTLTSSLIHYC